MPPERKFTRTKPFPCWVRRGVTISTNRNNSRSESNSPMDVVFSGLKHLLVRAGKINARRMDLAINFLLYRALSLFFLKSIFPPKKIGLKNIVPHTLLSYFLPSKHKYQLSNFTRKIQETFSFESQFLGAKRLSIWGTKVWKPIVFRMEMII